jgi:3-phenylpropionate/trans-cinnamate dioxygenase ferredoxin reductase subunit
VTHVVVIGAGQAGASLVARLRAEGHDGPITLLGSEAAIPYQRPPLSKAYLLGEMDEDRLSLRSAAWYADQAITLRTGTTVTAIDPAGRTLALADGTTLAYDALALTTGSRARRLPAAIGGDLDGVLTMRDRADADRMAPRLVPGARVLIIGGGYIGLEAAAVCATRGLHVTLIEMAPRILQRVAAPQTSDWFRALHRSHGVDIRESTGLDRLIGDTRVTAARLADGTELAVDFALVGVGILPNAELAAAAGLATDNGIVTDSHCRTSDPHIWAAGDCATLDWHGTRIRLESVGNAIDQAECAALNILGRATPYVPQPWFWSDQYDCKLQIAGLNLGYDSVHVRLTDASSRSHWYYRGDRLIAVDAINDSRAYMIGKRLIEMGKSPPPAVVTDPATDLKPLLRA